MSDATVTAGEIIEKFEVPKDLHEAVFEAYAEGVKRGFIRASIEVITSKGA